MVGRTLGEFYPHRKNRPGEEVLAIHGLEEYEGKRFLVLELVEGQTLAQCLLKGPLPLGDRLEYGIPLGAHAVRVGGVLHVHALIDLPR
jgi:hypothetical protein